MRINPRRHWNPWNSPSDDVPLWTQLYTAPGTILPVACYFRDLSFLTKVGNDVSGLACAWASGHDGAQANPADRPSDDGTDIVFTVADTENLDLDYSTPEVSGDWTFFVGCNPTSTAAAARYTIDFQTGRLIICQHDSLARVAYYDGGFRSSVATAATTGNQVLTYELKDPADGAIYRNGGLLDSGFTYGAKALGGNVSMGSNHSSSASAVDQKVRAIPIYKNTNAVDRAVIDTIMATVMGL